MRRATPVLILVAVLAGPAPAAASFDPIGGGTTALRLDQAFEAFLGRNRVQLTATAPAQARDGVLVFPVSGGNFDPGAGKGEIEQDGALVLANTRKRVPIRKLMVKTSRSPLIARVGGSQLRLATTQSLRSARRGFGVLLRARRLLLTAKVATRLNKKLRTKEPFTAGQPIGTLVSKPQPQLTAILPAGRATLNFDPAFVAKLDRRFVAINPIFPAEHEGPSFTLPIGPGGALAPDGSLGTLRSTGEIEFLQLGAGQVFWHELWFDLAARTALAEVDLEPTPAFPGKLGQIPILAMGTAPIASNAAARTIGLAAAPLSLTAQTADSFNRAFAAGDSVFSEGEVVGALSFTAQGQ